MIFNGPKLIAAGLLASALSGCATNTIRIDRAATMTEAGRKATGATRTLMDETRAENREALIDIVASDPGCKLPEPLIAQGNDARGVILCRRGTPQRNDFTIPRLTPREFEPSLAVIDGLVAYFDAVDAVITRDPIDLGGTVIDAATALEEIVADVTTVTGSNGAQVPALSADQKAAARSVLDLLGEIIDEAERVNDLRKIELALDQPKFTDSLRRLELINDHWLRNFGAHIDTRLVVVKIRLLKNAPGQYERRRALAEQQMVLIERKEAVPELNTTLAKTVVVLRLTHTDYRALLFGDRRLLTLKEKRKAAQITRARLRAALSSLAKIVKAF